ncbi:MAG: sensor histidine kinase [Betaproteobacteria bacterium]|nr:sensor histidine kinase [Betaproteobacteria bacterium]
MNVTPKLSLVGRFLLTGFLVLLAGMALVGTWVGDQIEKGVLSGTGVVTSIYLDGAVSRHLQSLAGSSRLNEADRVALDRILAGTHFGERAVALTVWAPDGRVIYNNPDVSLEGRLVPIKGALAAAFAGQVRTQRASLADAEDASAPKQGSRLIETYAPIRADNDGSIIAVAGFYQTADDLEDDLRAAQMRSWAMQAAVTLAILALFTTLVRRANDTINAQQRELREKVSQLTALLAQNEHLHDRVSRAAARTTALNERFLRHVAADLHDGPGQGLALASMRIESLAEICNACAVSAGKGSSVAEDFRTLHLALQSALADLRAILRGMHLPEIEQLTIADTVRRAVSDHERKSGREVPLAIADVPDDASVPVKMTLFRVLQESLANGFRHGGECNQRVAVAGSDDMLSVEVADDGKGFDPRVLRSGVHLGLAGMRERVEALGGNFAVASSPNNGTTVRATLPLSHQENHDD